MNEVIEMLETLETLRRRRGRQVDRERYARLSAQVGRAEAASGNAQDALARGARDGAKLSVVRQAYETMGHAAQEPLPAEPALDPNRPSELTRRLSTLRTCRQWYLMDDPPGVLAPAAVRPRSRAPLGPHIAGLDADFAERPWGVDLKRALDEVS